MSRTVIEQDGKVRLKYIKFTDKIKMINPDIIHQVGKIEQMEPGANDSYFRLGLEQWRDLNCTAQFGTFYGQVKPFIDTFTQVVYHKDTIMAALMSNLQEDECLAYEPLLSLLTMLAQDLRGEFYQYFPQVVTTLSGMLRKVKQDTMLIEKLFHTLGFLYKYLRKQLAADFVATFETVRFMLNDRQSYVRWFAAPGLAYLLRKCTLEQLPGIMEHLVGTCTENDDQYVEGLAVVLFETMKGTTHNFHSRAIVTLDIFVEKLPSSAVVLAEKVLVLMAIHGDSQSVHKIIQLISQKLLSNQQGKFEVLLNLLEILVSIRKGSRVQQSEGLIKTTVLELMQKSHHVQLLSVFSLLLSRLPTDIQLCRQTEIIIMKSPYEEVKQLITLLSKLEVEATVVLLMCQRIDRDFSIDMFNLLAESSVDDVQPYYFKGPDVVQHFEDSLILGDEEQLLKLFDVLVCLRHHRASNQKYLVKLLCSMYSDLQRSSQEWRKVALIANVALTLDCMGQHEDLTGLLRQHPGHEVLLKAAAQVGVKGQLEDLYSLLKCNLKSPLKSVRVNTLRILQMQGQINWKDSASKCNLFELMLNVEEQPDAAQNAREKLIHVNRILTACVSKRQLPSFYLEAVPLFCLGQLTVNFKPIWKDVLNLLWSFSKISSVEVIWKLVWNELVNFGSDMNLKAYDLDGLSDQEVSEYKQYLHDMDQVEERGESFKDGEFCDSTVFQMKLVREGLTSECDSSQFRLLQMFNVQERVNYRFDALNFFGLLVKGVKDNASHVEKQASDVIKQEFLKLAKLYLGEVKDTRKRLVAFGDMLVEFKHIQEDDELLRIFKELLIMNDIQLQQIALKCMSSIKSTKIQPHMEMLHALLDEKSFRQTMTTLTLNGEDAVLTIDQKQQVLPIILRILFSKMSAKNAADISKVKVRRTALLSFLTGLETEELAMFINLLLEPYKKSGLSASTHIGFLHKLAEAVKQLGTTLIPFMTELYQVMIRIGRSMLGQEGDKWKEVRVMLSKAVLSLYKLPLSGTLLQCHQQFAAQLFEVYIGAKLDKFEMENIQAPSALMELFGLWCFEQQLNSFLVQVDDRVFPKMLACLSATGVKPSVVSCVLQAVEDLIVSANQQSEVAHHILQQNASKVIDNVAQYMNGIQSGNLSKDTMFRKQIWVLAELVKFSSNISQIQQLVDLLLPFLSQPEKFVPETTKCDILRILLASLDKFDCMAKDVCQTSYYSTVCRLFATLVNRSSRLLLLEVYSVFSTRSVSLQMVQELLVDLNAYSDKYVDQPDWNKRMDAFGKLNDTMFTALTYDQWHPILHNLVNNVMLSDEDIIRRTASFSLTKFVERVASVGASDPLYQLLIHVVLAAVKNGFKSRTEAVCAECVGILKSMVQLMPQDEQFCQLVPLLADGDEEASFFSNIYHVQMHRRSRAMRRFVDLLEQHTIKPVLLSKIFVPIMQHFIYSHEKAQEQQTVTDAILAVGAIAKHLPWNMYIMMVRQYFKLLKANKLPAKVVMRLIIAVLSNFHWKDESTIMETLEKSILPELYALIVSHKEGEANLQLRVPVAIAYAKLLQFFPNETLQLQLPKLLTNIAQILRSRGQEVRDVARTTLVTIAEMFADEYFLFVLKELKGALTKGYQLHVLGYTIHSLLSQLHFQHGSLDRCLGLLLPILTNDVFGQVASEKEVDELTSKSKEYKNKRGFESFELLARNVSVKGLDRILMALKNLMLDTSSSAFTRGMVDVLRRICIGLLDNEDVEVVESLKLVADMLNFQSKYFEGREVKDDADMENYERNYTVAVAKRADHDDIDHMAQNAYMLQEFGLRVLYGIIRKKSLDDEVLLLLDELLPSLTQSLSSKHSTAVKLAMKISGLVFKLNLQSTGDVVLQAIDKCYEIIQRYEQLNHQMVQDSLRLLASILRDCQTAVLEEEQVTFILKLILPELHKSDDQSVTFQFIKAVLNKKVINDEITAIVEVINSMMVTHQAAHVRSLCRQISVQYLLDYQVGPSQMKRFVDFLVQNLSYVYESGRLSCIEVIQTLVLKFSKQFVEDYGQILCMALFLRLANDDSVKCKGSAVDCLRTLVPKLTTAQIDFVIQSCSKWLQSQNAVFALLGIQVVGLLLETIKDTRLQGDLVPMVQSQLVGSLNDREQGSSQWMLTYHAVNCFQKAFSSVLVLLSFKELKLCMMDVHLWVRSASTKLLQLYLSQNQNFSEDDIVEFVRISCAQLKSPLLEEQLGTEILKNLCRMVTKLPAEDKNLGWLCKKMSSMCRDESNSKSALLRSLIFKWFASVVTQVEQSQLQLLAPIILGPVYRISVDEQTKFEGFQELKVLSIELLDLIEKTLGSQLYFAIRSQVEQQVSHIQQERRKKSQQLAVQDPQASAKRKQDKSAMKQQARKRKTQELNEKFGKRIRRLL